MESTFVLEADAMHLCQQGEHFRTLPSPAVAGGYPPSDYSRQIFYRVNGTVQESAGLYYVLNRGDKLRCLCQGGCGVGNPLERDVLSVDEDVRNELVSVDRAASDYGVVVDPNTSKVDEESTLELRERRRVDGRPKGGWDKEGPC